MSEKELRAGENGQGKECIYKGQIYTGDIVFTSIYIDYYYTHVYPKKDSDSNKIVFRGNK